MKTKNIQDVVAERVEELYKKWDSYDEPENDQYGFMAQDGRVRVEFVADWLTTTLTQLVKEVEAGERNRILSKLEDADFRGIGAKMEWLGKPLVGYTAITNKAFKILQEFYAEAETTPPTSDEEKVHGVIIGNE